MDFIVSKVAMSVAALVTVGVAGGVFDLCLAPDEVAELEGVLQDLAARLMLVASTGPGSTSTWTVPQLSTGDAVTMHVSSEMFSASSSGERAFREPPVEIHTWQWEGMDLNMSIVETLDEEAMPLCVESGSSVLIEVIRPTAGDCTAPLLLVHAED